MASNRNARESLVNAYGKECFIEKLGLRNNKKRRVGKVLYTGEKRKKLMSELTFHHMKMKKDGGERSFENGAILRYGNHVWFHQQSTSAQSKMNQAFQDYKECKTVFVEDLYPFIDYKVTATQFSTKDLERHKEIHNKNSQKNELRKITIDYIDR